MYQFKGCSKVQIRWIHKYLFLLKNLACVDKSVKLSDITFEHLQSASKSLKVKKHALQLIEKNRSGEIFNADDLRFIQLILENQDYSSDKLVVIKAEDSFEEAIDVDFTAGISNDEMLIKKSLYSALELINTISPTWKSRMSDVLETVIGVFDERNVINSGFTKDFPGFINLNINADVVVLGEQIAHETTHLIFDNYLYFNNRAKKIVQNIPPIFSIFAQKPRSAELVLHGLFSYTSVFLFWDSLQSILPNEKLRINLRKRQVLRYIQESLQDLNNVLTVKDWASIIKMYRSICPIFSGELWQIEKVERSFTNKEIVKLQKQLNDIELAEIVLAIEGNKVSRISKPISQVRDLIKIIHTLPVYYCFSSYLFSSKSDSNINDFQNVITSIYNLDTYSSEKLDIHIYLSNNSRDLLSAYKLDQQEKCAPLFKTPKCCERFFNNNWEYAVKELNGDITKIYFEDSQEIQDLSDLVYNPIGMYFGLGFCWHFPCKLNCKSTKRVVDNRLKILKKYQPLFNRLNRINQYTLRVDQDRNYSLLRAK